MLFAYAAPFEKCLVLNMNPKNHEWLQVSLLLLHVLPFSLIKARGNS